MRKIYEVNYLNVMLNKTIREVDILVSKWTESFATNYELVIVLVISLVLWEYDSLLPIV